MLTTLMAAAAGTLVIVGGALDPGNAAVFGAFAEAAGKDSAIAVIPAASGTPTTSARNFAEDIARHGVVASRVVTVRVAAEDDPATPDIDERRWASNASDPAEIAKIERAGGIWFTGGDQSRIVATLVAGDGSDTPLLAAIRKRLAAGAVVGGTSAGAAIMSGSMILQGDSLAALLPAPAGEPLKVGRGLGFFPRGIVDQHFDARARLGRLSVALATLPVAERMGYGIDENTALIVDLARGTAKAVGAGYVTLIDARTATYIGGKRLSAEGLSLGVASGGDVIDLADQTVTPAAYKKPTIGREYNNTSTLDGGGMAVPGGGTAATIGGDLIDNRAATRIDRLSFSGGRGVVYRFAKRSSSRGWWGRDADGIARYAVEGIVFAILPIDITVKGALR